MSKIVTITAYCDGVHQGPAPEAIVERTVALNGGGARTVDLCATCDERVFRPLEAILANGAPAAKGAVQKTTRQQLNVWMPCPEPDCDGGGNGRAGLGMHTRRKHDKLLADYPETA
jgi:hypothetical protein